MSEWKEVKLGEIAKVISGYAFKSVDFIKDDAVPAIKIKNIKTGEIDLKDVDFVSENFLSLNEKYHVKYNDILISLTGSHLTQPNSVVGRVGIYKHKITSLLNQRAGKILPNLKLVNQLFLYSFLSQDKIKETIALKARGAANQANISPSDVEDTDILLPPLPTQQRIASILSAYDDLIENNLKRIKLLEEIAQRTYEEWFVKFRINGVQLEVGENGLPEGWERKKLNEAVDIVSGYAFKSKEYIEDGNFKIVTIKNVQDGYFIPQTTDTIKTMPNNLKESQILKTGDFILSLTGNVGRTCMVYGDNFLLNQRVAKIVVKNTINNAFIYCLLRSRTTIRNLENMSNGAAQQNLSPVNMGNMTIVLGNENILIKYSQKFKASLNLICKLNIKNSLLKESRDILLPRLMSGKVGE